MNPIPPQDSREALEVRLTALLLGELSETEAAEVRKAIGQDPALAALHDRLQKAIHFVRETAADSKRAAAEENKAERLSETRRQELLTKFKTVKPVEFARPRWNFRQWLVPMGAAAILTVMLFVLGKGRLEQHRYLAFGDSTDESSASSTKALMAKGPAHSVSVATPLEQVQTVNSPAPASDTTINGNAVNFQGRLAHAAPMDSIASTPTVSPSPMAAPATERFAMRLGKNGVDTSKGVIQEKLKMSELAAPQPAVEPPRKPASASVPVVRGTVALPVEKSSVDFSDGDTASSITLNKYQAEPGGTDGNQVFYRLRADSESKPQSALPSSGATSGKKVELAKESTDSRQAQDEWAFRAQDGKDKAPVLGDMPVTGRLFNNTSQAGEAKAYAGKTRDDVSGIVNLDSFDATLPGAGGPGGKAGYAVNSDGRAQLHDYYGLPAKAAHEKEWFSDSGNGNRQQSQVDGKGSIVDRLGLPQAREVAGKDLYSGITDRETTYVYSLNNGDPQRVQEDLNGLFSTKDADGAPQTTTALRNSLEHQTQTGLRGYYDDNLNAPADQKTELGRMRELKKDSFVGGDAISTDGTSAYAYNLNAPITLGEELKKQVADEDRDALSKNLPRRAGSYGLSIQPSAGQNLRRDLEVAKNGKASFSETAQTATEGTSDLNVNGSTVVSGGAMTVPAPHVINQPPPATLAFNRSGGGGYGGGGGMGGMGGKMGGASVSGGRGGGGSGGAIGNQSGGAQAGSFSTRLDGFVNGSQPAEQQLTSGLRSSGARQDRSPASDKDVKLKAGEPSYKSIETKQKALAQLEGISVGQKIAPTESEDRPAPRLAPNAPMPQPEMLTHENAFSTFSLNVADVSFKLAAASLDKGVMPDPSTVRSEEFINAFDYRDPEPAAGAPVAFAWERARYPFAHNRDLLRFSVKTAALGRQAGRPLNVVLLLDNSGSMERADRVRIIHESLRVLASQLKPEDRLSVVTFSRTSRLWVDGVPGNQAAQAVSQVDNLTPQGGTNLEEAMNLAYETALRHYQAGGVNRVVLLTDGAANLGNVDPDALKQKVESHRKQGVALDCFGIGWEGYNDDLLESLSRNGDGRYGFINTPEAAATEFAGQLAGALHVAASDVKVQVEFNPARVTAWRQIGYAKHQLKKEQFRDNTVDAAEIAAQEAGNALYTAEVNPAGEGPLAVVRLRYKVPGTTDYREQEWTVPFTGNAPALEQSGTAMRLAASAGAFAEWLVSSPFSGEVTPDRLLALMRGVPEVYGADNRPRQLETMIREAKSISGK